MKERTYISIDLKSFYASVILKGMNLEEDATAKVRNERIGGHKI